MSNQNNVKLSQDQLNDYWKEVSYAASRKSKNGVKISISESVGILKKYFGGDSPILNINDPLPGQKGWTVVYFAAYFGSVDECKALLKMGANPEMFVQQGNSLLHIAAAKNYASLCNVLIRNGFDVDKVNNTGKTSLMSACQSGSIDSGVELLDNNASTDIIDKENKTCFTYASEYSNKTKDHTMETILLDRAMSRDIPLNQIKPSVRHTVKF